MTDPSRDSRWVMYGHPDADPRDANDGPGPATARGLLARLCDPDLLGGAPGLPSAPVTGDCRLCALTAALSYEHIPPGAAGNRTRARGVSSWTMLDAGSAGFPSSGWTPAQRGTGAHVLCEPCNNRCGADLINEYVAFAAAMTDLIGRAAVRGSEDQVGFPSTIDTTIPGYAVGNVARQALAMLLAVSGGAAVTRLHPELLPLVRGDTTDVPSAVRLGGALAPNTGRVRLSPPHAMFAPGLATVFCEVAAPPLRWTLSWTGEGLSMPERVLDVTDWLAVPLDQPHDVQAALPLGMVDGPAPGDTRTATDIERQPGEDRTDDGP